VRNLLCVPGCCLAWDEDGVAKTGADVVMLESVDPPEFNSWFRRSSCGAGEDTEKTKSDRDAKWSTPNGNMWSAGEATEFPTGPVQAPLMHAAMEGFISVADCVGDCCVSRCWRE
jgi:hypothetical protein